jgi:uncharacterized membrane protein
MVGLGVLWMVNVHFPPQKGSYQREGWWVIGAHKTACELPSPYITFEYKTGFSFEEEGEKEMNVRLL